MGNVEVKLAQNVSPQDQLRLIQRMAVDWIIVALARVLVPKSLRRRVREDIDEGMMHRDAVERQKIEAIPIPRESACRWSPAAASPGTIVPRARKREPKWSSCGAIASRPAPR